MNLRWVQPSASSSELPTCSFLPAAVRLGRLHGVTLEHAVTTLVERYGWEELANRIRINCFKNDPSVKSSLKFLRKTTWARQKVEDLHASTLKESRA